ncbi:hypothetical protein ACLKA6_007298 [Drosophila palustris]
MKMPKTTDDWLRIAKEFNDLWNFPHCLCALAADGSLYFNYKGFNSIVLLALVDANYNFLYVDIGCNGRANDASVFNASSLCMAMEKKQLNIPQDKELEENGEKMPYVIVAAETFKLQKWLMKPHRQRTTKENKIFNYRLSRARRVVENALFTQFTQYFNTTGAVSWQSDEIKKFNF